MQTTRALGSRYVLDRVLGTGAMGEVWAATDQRTGEAVAAKLLRQEYARDPEIIARFVQERSILLDLVHPNVVRVRDLVVEGDDLAIVMDLVEGSDLRAVLRRQGTLPPAEAVRVAVDVLSALVEAHGRGVLHRDVKPDNVLVDAGDPPRVLLSDFSIARLAQETTVRMTGVLGTAEYMAPEVFTAETVSPASDVYGTGVLLYELLAGRTPFAGGGTGYAVANRHVTAQPPPVPGLPSPLDAVLLGMLAKDPTRRPTAAAAAAALRAVHPELAGVPPVPVQPQPANWVPVAAAPPAMEVLGHRPADLADPGRTNVKAAAPAPAPAPVPAAGPEAVWVGPREQVDDDVLAGRTQLRAPRHAAPDVDVPPPAAPAPRRPRWLVAAAVAAVVAVVGGGVVALASRDDASRDDAAAAAGSGAGSRDLVTAVAPAEQLPSGLQAVREAAYDPEASTLTTTVTWTAGSAPLSGPLFEAVPPATDGAPCPDALWDVPALRDTTPGVSPAGCGWQVQVGEIPARGSVQASVTVPFEPDGDDAVTALRERLALQLRATGEALDGIVASPVYPVQRLEALEVQIGGSARVGAPVDTVVLPVWRGTQSADNVDVLFSSRSPQANSLLRQLGGALEVRTDDCTGAIAFTGGVPYANTVGQRCTLSVRLGEVEARSRSFDVLQNSVG